MPKLKNPPQGGEKYLCLTLFCTMMLSVVSAVAIIYSIVIIYVPSKIVLESNMTGPIMCTTLSNERDIDSIEHCHNWSSCEEWCLSKVIIDKDFILTVGAVGNCTVGLLWCKIRQFLHYEKMVLI